MTGKVRYTIVIPVYNEAVVHETYRRLTKVMQSIGEPYELLFVNDGSQDWTGKIIESLAAADGCVRKLDFSLCDVMRDIREKNRYVRGLVSWAGFQQAAVEYVREERFAGETKYPFKKMLRLAADGIASFSCKSLRLALPFGLLVSSAGLAWLAFSLGRLLLHAGEGVGWRPSLPACFC
ncbi:hypothetical membrane protein [Pelotomaculum thermopropionicum SI]|uniref:Hypothetical membrane protein n=1 Tax=Pelotomaculum thermopropionicum (strain DSM 13744 / JCM 10971 / SI) TaxID=370438 RepID=A5D6A2_PELTS|nr:hypothetical membrane protein [Pelotomaculum thermopropionicum SI]